MIFRYIVFVCLYVFLFVDSYMYMRSNILQDLFLSYLNLIIYRDSFASKKQTIRLGFKGSRWRSDIMALRWLHRIIYLLRLRYFIIILEGCSYSILFYFMRTKLWKQYFNCKIEPKTYAETQKLNLLRWKYLYEFLCNILLTYLNLVKRNFFLQNYVFQSRDI